MKYLQYLFFAALVAFLLFLVLALFSTTDYARKIVIVTSPLALWSGRLIASFRRGRITRRIASIDGGDTLAGNFFSFSPDEYVREPGFDNFKGYFIRECVYCALGWIMFLSVSVVKILDDHGIDVG